MRIFVAGASGVIGRQLVPMLVAAGHEVSGTTRRRERLASLEAMGAAPVLLDATDSAAVTRAVEEARPEVVIHQLTDLAAASRDGYSPTVLAANARLRTMATAHLVAAAETAGVRRVVAQSGAWLYAAGPEPHREDDPLGASDEAGRLTLGGILALEGDVLGAHLEGVVLRYGLLYGPGTGSPTAAGRPSVHVEAAARAALLAVEHGSSGIYNIVDDGGGVSNDRARQQLSWVPLGQGSMMEGS